MFSIAEQLNWKDSNCNLPLTEGCCYMRCLVSHLADRRLSAMRAQEVSLPSTTCVYSASGRNQLAAVQMAAVKSLLHQHRYHLSIGLPHICVSTFAAWGGPKIQRHRHGHSQHMRKIWQAFATSNAKCRSLCPSPQEESKREQSEYLTNQPVRSERTSTVPQAKCCRCLYARICTCCQKPN